MKKHHWYEIDIQSSVYLEANLVGSQLRWTARLIFRKDCDYEMEALQRWDTDCDSISNMSETHDSA